jgi:PAS domain S-box-containing protein
MIQINDGISKLNQAMGFGGYIHNFKNYVIRNDKVILDELDNDILMFDSAIKQLLVLFTEPDEHNAINTLRETIHQYQLNLATLKQPHNNLSVSQRDKLVQVDDSDALDAMSLLTKRTFELNKSHNQVTQMAFNHMVLWLLSGGFLLLFIIVFALSLLKAIHKLKAVYIDLAKALEQSDLLIAHAPDAMVSITEEGVIVRCNEQICRLFGYSKEELLDRSVTILLPDDIKDGHHLHVSSYFNSPSRRIMGQGSEGKPLFGKHKNGKLIPVEISLSSSLISGKRISTATIRDISLRVEAENKLKVAVKLAELNYLKLQQAQNSLNEKQMINLMLNKLPLCTLLLNEDAEVLLINETLLTETGYDKQEINDLAFDEYIKANESKYSAVMHELKSKKQINQNENLTFLGTLITKQEVMIPVEISISSYSYNLQVYRLLSLKNLSDIKLIEDKLVNSVERFTRIISAIEDGIWEWDLMNNTVDYSPQFMKIIGCENEAIPQFSHWFEHIHPDYRNKVHETIAAHFASKDKYEVEYLGLNHCGEYNWFFSIGNSIFNDDDEAVMMSGSLRNIHHRKLLETAFAEKSQFLTTIYEGSSHAIWVLNVEADNEFRFAAFNRTACRRIGVTEQDVINKTITELMPSIFEDQDPAHFINHYTDCVNSAQDKDYIEYIDIDNEERWYQTSLYPIKDANGHVIKIVGTAIDISEQKRSEKDLEEHKLFLEKMIDSAVCGLYVYNLQRQKNVLINSRHTEILGYTMDELNNHADFMSLFHPDDYLRVLAHTEKVAESKNGELYSLKFRFKSKEGAWVCCYLFSCIIKYDGHNNPLLMLGTFVDITEITLLMDQLQESNEYLERFAFVASHDLQEPLRKITAFSTSLTNRLQTEIQNDSTIEFEFSRLINASERMRDMIKDLLKLSRISSSGLDLKSYYLSDILKQSIDLLSHSIEEKQVEFELIDTKNKLQVDQGLLVQLFQNLISNSIKFKAADIAPKIKISSEILDGNLVITYKDNGIGIAEKFVEQIFEPFRRLHSKDKYTGSGIGLALCRQIVTVHGGVIECGQDVKLGAEFIITIPLVTN